MTPPWEGPDKIGLEARAKALYDARQSRAHCPTWEQLGDTTRGVWHEMVLAEMFGELA